MKILALEFSSPQRSVAVAQTAPEFPEARINEIVETGPGATRALGNMAEVLRAANLAREQIECVAVGLGPGSYTGIRTSLALAQGWQLSHRVKLLGISSVECLVAQAQAEGLAGRVTAVVDAQRGEFYLANCKITDRQRVIAPLLIAGLSELRERAQAGEILIGPNVSRWIPQGRDIFPRAATLTKLALGRNDFVAGNELEPVYLRATGFVKAKPSRILP